MGRRALGGGKHPDSVELGSGEETREPEVGWNRKILWWREIFYTNVFFSTEIRSVAVLWTKY